RKIPLDRPSSRAALGASSPTGLVPVLVDETLLVWDSLAICETLAEWFPDARLWPEDPSRRALARSAAAEIHAGFHHVREELPMDLTLRTVTRPSPLAQAEIERICGL